MEIINGWFNKCGYLLWFVYNSMFTVVKKSSRSPIENRGSATIENRGSATIENRGSATIENSCRTEKLLRIH